MKEAVIVTKSVAPGSYMPIGRESLNPFKKTRADIVRKKLRESIKEEQLDFKVDFDLTYGDLQELKQDGVAFYILTPFVSDYVELDVLDEKEYVVLTDEEYDNGDVARIIRKMKWMDFV